MNAHKVLALLSVASLGVCLALEKPIPTPTKSSKKQQHEPAQTNQDGQNQKCGTKETPCVVEVLPSDPRDVKTKQETSHEDAKAFYDRLIAWSTVGLACITGILAFYTQRLWAATKELAADAKRTGESATAIARDSADAAKANAKAAEENASAANKNAEFSKLNAIATQQAAEAANKNIEAFISRERARLLIEMKPLKFGGHWGSIDFIVKNDGSTSAYILDSSCAAFVCNEGTINDPDLATSIMMRLTRLPKVIPASGLPVEEFAVWSYKRDEPLEGEIKQNRLLVGIRGWIKYRDVFDRERQTTFRQVWKYAEFMGTVYDWGEWHQGGIPDENRQT
jgi:hypothetical protein